MTDHNSVDYIELFGIASRTQNLLIILSQYFEDGEPIDGLAMMEAAEYFRDCACTFHNIVRKNREAYLMNEVEDLKKVADAARTSIIFQDQVE